MSCAGRTRCSMAMILGELRGSAARTSPTRPRHQQSYELPCTGQLPRGDDYGCRGIRADSGGPEDEDKVARHQAPAGGCRASWSSWISTGHPAIPCSTRSRSSGTRAWQRPGPGKAGSPGSASCRSSTASTGRDSAAAKGGEGSRPDSAGCTADRQPAGSSPRDGIPAVRAGRHRDDRQAPGVIP